MDAAGKDSTIKHVMSGINPQGCQVSSFKAPSAEELAHDFLWRTTLRLPERGHIGVFNRSYYEEVLVVRVHPEILGAQRLPPAVVSKRIWHERFEDITCFERHLQRSGVAVLKFFLHVSKDEQKKRFLERLDTPSKNWKFALGDVRERGLWREYMDAYEDMIRHTATPEAPWFVVPADHKWFARLVVIGRDRRRDEEARPALPDRRSRAEENAESRRGGAASQGRLTRIECRAMPCTTSRIDRHDRRDRRPELFLSLRSLRSLRFLPIRPARAGAAAAGAHGGLGAEAGAAAGIPAGTEAVDEAGGSQSRSTRATPTGTR